MGTFLLWITHHLLGKGSLYVKALQDKNQAVACASDYGFLISSVVGAHEVWRI